MQTKEMRRLRFLRKAEKAFKLHDRAERENERRRDFLNWLNGMRGTVQYERICGLIAKMRELRLLLTSLSFPEFVEAEMSGSTNADAWQRAREINEQQSQGTTWPRITALTTNITLKDSIRPQKNGGPHSSPMKIEPWSEGGYETTAAHYIAKLEEDGLLGSLRQCNFCNKWFFATRPWQKFCFDECRDRHYSSTLKGREQRASYMRGYRRRLRRRDEESIRAVLRKKKR